MNATRLSFPGPELRPIPSFALDCAPGFAPVEVPDTVAAFIDTTAPAPFSSNLVIGVQRVASATTLTAVTADTLQTASATLPQYALDGERTTTIDTLPAAIRTQSFHEATIDRRLTQTIVFVLLPVMGTGQTVDLVHLTGTCLAEELERSGPIFLQMAESVEFFPEGS